MIDAYVTAVESQVYLSAHADWLALTDAEQDTHLSWGRVFIDGEYVCPYDETDATDDLKHANALTGYMNLQNTLFADVKEVESTSVSAGDVSSSKTYKSGSGASDKDAMFNQVDFLLKGTCTASVVSNTVALTRV